MLEEQVSGLGGMELNDVLDGGNTVAVTDRHVRHLIRKDPVRGLPVLTWRWSLRDRLGTLRAITGLGRNGWQIPPGLYLLGSPGPEDPVLATGNYRWSVDRVRRAMMGRSAFLLVLDTGGINVWCAAGKGSFSGKALVRMLKKSGVEELAGVRRVIVPQLGASSLEAHHVQRLTGWKVIYGPVDAWDLPRFLDGNCRGDGAMRKVQFPWKDRLRMVPVEIKNNLKYWLAGGLVFSLGYWLAGNPEWLRTGLRASLVVPLAMGSGLVLFSLLQRLLPFRSFGAGGLACAVLMLPAAVAVLPGESLCLAGLLLIYSALSVWLAFGLTGCSTYTSLSGVRREGRILVPLVLLGTCTGLAIWALGLWR